MQTLKTTTNQKLSKKLRLLIVAAPVALILFAGFLGGFANYHPNATNSTTLTATHATAKTATTLAAQQSVRYSAARALAPGSTPTQGLSPGDATNFLPINRWTTAAQSLPQASDAANPVGGGIVSPALAGVADIFFTIASWLWYALYTILSFAITNNIVSQAGNAMDSGFLLFSNAVTSSGLIAVVILLTIIAIATRLFKSSTSANVITGLLTMILPLAALYAMTNITATHATSQGEVPGTPSWIAVTGVGFADGIGNSFSSCLTAAIGSSAAPGSSDSSLCGGSGVALTPDTPKGYGPTTCTQYVNTLVTDYNTAATASTKPNQLSGAKSLAVVSDLWQTAYLSQWETAAFHDSLATAAPGESNGEYMYCHYLEGAAGVPLTTQQTLNGQAYAATGVPNADQIYVAPMPSDGTDNAGGGDQGSLFQTSILTWAGCQYSNGQWVANPAWKALASGDANWNLADPQSSPDTTAENTPSTVCAYRANLGSAAKWDTTAMPNPLSWTKTSDLDNDFGNMQNGASQSNPKILAAKATVTSYWGNNSSTALFNGLMAVIVALAYVWCLGALGIGAIVAELGLVIMMILLPATLIMLALPGKAKKADGGGGSSMHSTGIKMLRMTAGFFACRLVTTVVLVAMVYFILVLQGIATAVTGTGG